MVLNEIQQKASTILDKNISLISGAGTGKTGVLTQRFINIIKAQNGKFDNILALTFTDKATEEMNNRIYHELAKTSYDFNIDKLNIMTIHSFCKDLILSYNRYLHINSNFDLDNDFFCQILLKESIKKILSTYNNEDYLSFLLDLNFSIVPRDVEAIFFDLYNRLRNKYISLDDLKNASFVNFESCEDKNSLKNNLLDLGNNKSLKTLNKFVNSSIFSEIFDKENLDSSDLYTIKENLGQSKKFEDELNSVKEQISNLLLALDESNYKYYEIIIEILEKIHKLYTKEKRERGLLDFDDLLIYGNELVQNKDVSDKLNKKFTYILIDEFQDVNILQNNIICGLNSKNIFIVGDPQQAIYGFRGSFIGIFDNFYKLFRDKDKEILTLNMNKNYRTDASIISDINTLFNNIFTDYQGLVANNKASRKIEKYTVDDENDYLKLIKYLLSENDSKDIGILARTNGELEKLETYLKQNNIDVNRGKINLKQTQVIKFILSFLRSIFNKNDFTSFMDYISSPFCDLSFNSLVTVLLKGYRSIDEVCHGDISDSNLARAIDVYIKIKKIKNVSSLDYLIKKCIDEFRIFKLNRNDWDYILILYEKSIEFKEKGLSSFRVFERYIESVEVNDKSQGVNLLTIHKSKGLEFKTVVLINMSKPLSNKTSQKITFNKKFGLAIDSQRSNGKFDLINNEQKDINFVEERRVLYVAMTRARDRLIICSEKKQSPASYMSILNVPDNFFKEVNIDEEEYQVKINEDTRKLINLNEAFKYRYRQNYSITDFLNYDYDEDAYLMKFFFNIDTKKLQGNTYYIDPKVRGNMLHFFAEHYNEEKIDDYIEFLFKIFNEDINGNKFNEIRELIVNYLNLRDKEILYKELEFFYDFNGHIVRGFIDQVVSDEGIYIVDLKTSDLSEEELVKNYKWQLVFYSKVFKDIYKKEVKGAYIYSLKHCKKVPVEINDKIINELDEKFLKFIEQSRKINFYKIFS